MHWGYSEDSTIYNKEHCTTEVDYKRRKNIAINHTATHILDFLLRKV